MTPCKRPLPPNTDTPPRTTAAMTCSSMPVALSPRAEGLGEALASIYGAASRAQRQALMLNAPVTPYGTPTFWPFIAGERFTAADVYLGSQLMWFTQFGLIPKTDSVMAYIGRLADRPAHVRATALDDGKVEDVVVD